ncbi:hypothetical protein AB9M62_30605 [Bacillales bacterium AN1005]
MDKHLCILEKMNKQRLKAYFKQKKDTEEQLRAFRKQIPRLTELDVDDKTSLEAGTSKTYSEN